MKPLKPHFPLLILILFFASCGKNGNNKQSEKISTSPFKPSYLNTNLKESIPKGISVSARGKQINPDSISKPKSIAVKKPGPIPLHTNVFPVPKPQVVPVPTKLTAITPSENGIPPPKIVLTSGKIAIFQHCIDSMVA